MDEAAKPLTRKIHITQREQLMLTAFIIQQESPNRDFGSRREKVYEQVRTAELADDIAMGVGVTNEKWKGTKPIDIEVTVETLEFIASQLEKPMGGHAERVLLPFYRRVKAALAGEYVPPIAAVA